MVASIVGTLVGIFDGANDGAEVAVQVAQQLVLTSESLHHLIRLNSFTLFFVIQAQFFGCSP